jgi:hypothetical protein
MGGRQRCDGKDVGFGVTWFFICIVTCLVHLGLISLDFVVSFIKLEKIK